MMRLVTIVFRKSRTDATKRPLFSHNYLYLGLSAAFQPSPSTREMVCAHAYPVLATVSSLSLIGIVLLLLPQAPIISNNSL